MNKQFFAVIILVIVALVGLFTFTSKKDSNNESPNTSSSEQSSHIAGKADSNVTLIEYADFQCPACKSYFPIVTQLKEEYGDKVAFQFKHFPLVQIHQNAFIAARAAEAAGNQGKFFEMHDLLFENQETWASSTSPTKIFEGYAQELGLDLEKFKTDSASSGVADVINNDVKSAQAAGANSTPTFVLNGKKIDKSPQSIEDFRKLLDEALNNNQQ